MNPRDALTSALAELTGKPRRVTLRSGDNLTVWAELHRRGELVIHGLDFAPPLAWNEYEYWLTVPAKGVPIVRAALGGRSRDSVLGLLEAASDRIAATGEMHWLDEIGAPYKLMTHIDPGTD